MLESKKWKVKIACVGTPEELKDNQKMVVKFVLESLLKHDAIRKEVGMHS